MLDAVIFDVDGTLVDSVDFHAAAWQRAFAHFGFDVDQAKIRAQIGKGGDQLMPVFLPKATIAKSGPAIEAFRKELFARDYMPRVKGFPQVRALFEKLRADGKRLALASSAKGDELQAYKKAARIDDFDLAETSSDDAEKSKPHPDIFHAALARLDTSARFCAVVGDTPYDAEAALKADLRVTGVLSGGFADFDLRAAGASQIFEDPADLLDHYQQWIEGLD